jgi:phosphoserine phosphatase
MTSLFDFDGTLVPERNNLYWHLIRALPDPGMRAVKTAAFTHALSGLIGGVVVRAINADQMYKLLLLSVFSGLPVDMVEETSEVLADRIEELIFPEMEKVLADAEGPNVLVTSNTEPVVAGFCERAGLECVATRLHVAGGRYTGLVSGELNKGAEKVARVRRLDIDISHTTAYGNTLDDEEMLVAAGAAVLVNPGDDLARRRGLRDAIHIDAGRMNA